MARVKYFNFARRFRREASVLRQPIGKRLGENLAGDAISLVLEIVASRFVRCDRCEFR